MSYTDRAAQQLHVWTDPWIAALNALPPWGLYALALLAAVSPLLAGMFYAWGAKHFLRLSHEMKFVFFAALPFYAAWRAIAWGSQHLLPEMFPTQLVQVCGMQESESLQTLQILGVPILFFIGWVFVRLRNRRRNPQPVPAAAPAAAPQTV